MGNEIHNKPAAGTSHDLSGQIINRVANSSIISIDLEELFPEGERIAFDIAPLLVEGLMLREKDFREFIKTHEWSSYRDKYVALFCSTDAIVPRWAWMLLSSALAPFAKHITFGNAEQLESELYSKIISEIDPEQYRDQRVVIKGCSDKPVPVAAYVQLTALLEPVVKSIMYGEPCSTVPVFKRK